MNKLLGISTILLSTLLAATGFSDVIYDESVDGDLSGAFGAPDLLSVNFGANTILGQMGPNGDTGATNGNDADYFFFVVESGFELTGLTIDAYDFSPNDPGVSLLGYTVGSSFTGQDIGDVDGFVLFDGSSGDVLADLAGGTLGSGTYSIWIQETSPNIVDYGITLTVVPEPSMFVVSAVAAIGVLFRRRDTVR